MVFTRREIFNCIVNLKKEDLFFSINKDTKKVVFFVKLENLVAYYSHDVNCLKSLIIMINALQSYNTISNLNIPSVYLKAFVMQIMFLPCNKQIKKH